MAKSAAKRFLAPGQGEVGECSSVPLAASTVPGSQLCLPASRCSSERMWMRRTSSRSLGVFRPVFSALQWTDVLLCTRYVPLPSTLGGHDMQLGAEL